MSKIVDVVCGLRADGRVSLADFAEQVVMEDGLRSFSDLFAIAKNAGIMSRDPIVIFDELFAQEQHAQFH